MNEAIPQHPQTDGSKTENSTFLIIERAGRIADVEGLDFLEYRKHLGIPLATAILHEWLPLQLANRPVWLDFRGVRAINLSVAEELEPILMKHVAEQAVLGHHYPVYRGLQPNVAYTIHKASSWQWRLRNYAWGMLGPYVSYLATNYIPMEGLRYLVVDRFHQFINCVLVLAMRGKNTLPTDQIIRYPEKSTNCLYIFNIWAFPEQDYIRSLHDYFLLCQDCY
jgi:hypothetical protein